MIFVTSWTTWVRTISLGCCYRPQTTNFSFFSSRNWKIVCADQLTEENNNNLWGYEHRHSQNWWEIIEYKNSANSFGFCFLNKLPTRVSFKSSMCIDHCRSQSETNAFTIEGLNSDNRSLVLQLNECGKTTGKIIEIVNRRTFWQIYHEDKIFIFVLRSTSHYRSYCISL